MAIFSLLLTACSSGYTYELTTDDAKGLSAGELVIRQGVEVGEVTSVDLEKEKVVITIKTDEPLYEDQDFKVSWADDDGKVLELDRPDSDANALASGAQIEDRSMNLDLDFDLTLNGIEDIGKAIESGIESAFGRDGEKLESWARRMEDWADDFGSEAEKWGEEMEAWAEENEDEFKELEEKLDRWREDNEEQYEAFEEDLIEITKDHGIGSREWRNEVEELIRRYNRK